MEDIEIKVSTIVDALEDKKGIDIRVVDVSKNSSFTDRFIIGTGNSTSQVKALADSVDEAMKDQTPIDFIKEGYQLGRWVVLDYGEVVAHIFHKDEREFYSLERLWEEE